MIPSASGRFSHLPTPGNFLIVFLGVLIGTVIGVLPRVGSHGLHGRSSGDGRDGYGGLSPMAGIYYGANAAAGPRLPS